jgi:hypothetical protein
MDDAGAAGRPLTDEEWQSADDETRIGHIRSGGQLTPRQAEGLLRSIENDLLEEATRLGGASTVGSGPHTARVGEDQLSEQ